MKCGVSKRSQNEAPNEAKIHEKVSFAETLPQMPRTVKSSFAVLVGF